MDGRCTYNEVKEGTRPHSLREVAGNHVRQVLNSSTWMVGVLTTGLIRRPHSLREVAGTIVSHLI